MRRRFAPAFAVAVLLTILAPGTMRAQGSRPDSTPRRVVLSASAVTSTYFASGGAIGAEVALGRAVTLGASGSATIRTADEVTGEARAALHGEVRWWPARRAFEGWAIGVVAGRAHWLRDCPPFDCVDPSGELEAQVTRVGVDVGHHWLVGTRRRLAPHVRFTVVHQSIDAGSTYRPPRLDVQLAVGVGVAF